MRPAVLVLSMTIAGLPVRTQTLSAEASSGGPLVIVWYDDDTPPPELFVQESGAQGGRLSFGGDRSLGAGARGVTEVVKLLEYTGTPLKAIQLRIVATGGVRIRSVARGTDIRDEKRWSFAHDIKEGGAGVSVPADTAKIVILGNGPNDLKGGATYSLVEVTFDVPAMAGGSDPSLRLAGVLGSTPYGENARVTAGAPMRVAVRAGDSR